ncbi:MAG: MarR family transcriptional regulator [Chloroflexota bacterium]|nr:MarR family transcriptional regulator [Chloroflexota bacterium]
MQEPVKSYLPGIDAAEFAAWIGFLRLHTTLVRDLDAELRAAHGLPLSSFEVMNWLAYAPGRRIRMSVLADSVLLSLSGITRLIERLERDGLVTREPSEEDRRGSYAILTEAGLARLRQAQVTHAVGVRRRYLDPLTPEQVRTLGALWQQLEATRPVAAPTVQLE